MHNVAVFLDLDNLVIGTSEAKMVFDVAMLLEKVRQVTKGRIVLRRAYGDWRQHQQLPRQLALSGFELQSSVRLNNSEKNVADMQLAADAIETLLDDLNIQTYVIATGDRDFVPLVQLLRRRGKLVIGTGVRHTTNQTLVDLCDSYLFYDDMVERIESTSEPQLRKWVQDAAKLAFKAHKRIQASVFRETVQDVSGGAFGKSLFAKTSFSKLLERFPSIVTLKREGTTLYISSAQGDSASEGTLRTNYRTLLKKSGLRVISSKTRIQVIKDVVVYLRHFGGTQWQKLIEDHMRHYQDMSLGISKSVINDVLRVLRRANVIVLEQDANKPLSALQVRLRLTGDRVIQEAVMAADATYVRELQTQSAEFDWKEASWALYEGDNRVNYLKYALNQTQ